MMHTATQMCTPIFKVSSRYRRHCSIVKEPGKDNMSMSRCLDGRNHDFRQRASRRPTVCDGGKVQMPRSPWLSVAQHFQNQDSLTSQAKATPKCYRNNGLDEGSGKPTPSRGFPEPPQRNWSIRRRNELIDQRLYAGLPTHSVIR